MNQATQSASQPIPGKAPATSHNPPDFTVFGSAHNHGNHLITQTKVQTMISLISLLLESFDNHGNHLIK